METVVVKNYIDMDYMFNEIKGILIGVRDDVIDDYGLNKDIPDFPEYSDDGVEESAWEMVEEFNDSMGKYLNSKNHKIESNINNIDYDYPYHINGEVEYDFPLVQAMIERLNNEEESKQANEDRAFLVDWFFETFGTCGIELNYRNEMVETLYQAGYIK